MTTTTTTHTGETEATLAPVITALHEVYATLSEHVADTEGVTLPPAIFTVQRSARAWGHITLGTAWNQETEVLDEEYAYAGWAVSMGVTPLKTVEKGFHEIMVSGENLSRGAVAVFGTVAHETAHAVNLVKGIRDTDSNGRHNKKFKTTAEQVFGLEITKVVESIGWSHTEVPKACAEKWAECIAKIDDALVVMARHPEWNFTTGRGGAGFGGFTMGGAPKGRNKNLLKAECGCGGTIRASRTTLAKGITCDECGENYEVRG
jgi:hypothetical protein